MAQYLLLMHNDARDRGEEAPDWRAYLEALTTAGALQAGSAIGEGDCVRRSEPAPGITRHLVGYIKIEARDLDHARDLARANPVYMRGGTVEIRELPKTS